MKGHQILLYAGLRLIHEQRKGLILKAIQKHLTAGKIVPAIEEALKGIKDSPNDSNLLLLLGDH